MTVRRGRRPALSRQWRLRRAARRSCGSCRRERRAWGERLSARLLIFAASLAALLSSGGSGLAFFTAGGNGSAAASAGALGAPTIVDATSTSGRVALSWTAVSAPSGGSVTYYVRRDGGSAGGDCPSPASQTTETSCIDSGLDEGSYLYTVTAVWRSWSSMSSTSSVLVSPGAATHLVLSAVATTPLAGSGDEVTIVAKDAENRTVSSYTGVHHLTFVGAGSAGSFDPTVTDKDGNVVVFGSSTAIAFTDGVAAVSGGSNGVMTLYRAESAVITVTDGSIGSTGLHVTVNANAAAGLTVAPATATPTAGAPFEVTVTARDAYGNTASAFSGSKSLDLSGPHVAPDGTHSPTWAGTQTATFLSGSVVLTTTLYAAETTALTAVDVAAPTIGGLSPPVTVDAAAAASIASTGGSDQSATVGTAFANRLIATVKDAYANTKPGATVTFEAPAGRASFALGGTCTDNPTPYRCVSSTDGAGVATSSTFTAGTVAATYSLTAATPGAGSTSFTETNAAAAIDAFVVANPGAQTAGAAFSVAITATDVYSNVASGYTGTHCLRLSGPSDSPDGTTPGYPAQDGCPAGQSGVTFNSGVASASLTLYDAAPATSLTVSDVAAGKSGTSAAFSVRPSSIAALVLAAGTATPSAGVPDDLTVKATDAYGNTATAYAGDHALTFGGAGGIGSYVPTVTDRDGVAKDFGAATTLTFANGTTTVSSGRNGVMRLYRAQSAAITVTDGIVDNGTGLPVTVHPTGTAVALALSAATISPVASADDDLTVTARDAYGNTEPTYVGSKNLTFGGAGIAPDGTTRPTVTNASGGAIAFGSSTAITFTGGIATVGAGVNGVMRLYKAENASITVTDGSIDNGAGLPVTVRPGAAAALMLTAATTTPLAGVATSLTITAKDAYANVATSYGGDRSLTFSGAGAIGGNNPTVTDKNGTARTFGAATAIAFAGGLATTSSGANGVLTLYRAESASIMVGDGTIGSGGLLVTASPAAPASLSVSGYATPTVAGVSHPFAVNALDAFGNVATGYGGTVHFTATNDAQAVLPADATLTAGAGSFNATFKTVAGGTKTLSATDTVTTSITGGQSAITVTATAASMLAFTTPTVSGQAATSATLGPITVQQQDQFGNAVVAGAGGVSVALSSNSTGTATFAAASAGSAVTSVTIPGGSSTVSFFYADTKAGTPTITANAGAGPFTASQQETITAAAATAMVFINCSTPGGNTTCAGQPIRMGNNNSMTFNVQTLDGFGNPSAPSSTLTIAVSGDANFRITSGTPATITAASTTTGQLTVAHNNSNTTATITAHVTSGPALPDATMMVKR